MKSRVVRYQDGRVEIIRILAQEDVRRGASSDPLAHETSIMWLEDFQQLPFVRVLVVRNCKSQSGKLMPSGDGRVLGYSKLTRDAPVDPVTGGFVRRVFYLRNKDFDPSLASHSIPRDAIDPRTLLPGSSGQKVIERQDIKEQELARHPASAFAATPRTKNQSIDPADDEVMQWLADSMGPNLSSIRVSDGAGPQQNDQASVDTELSHDVPFGYPKSLVGQVNKSNLGQLIPKAGGESFTLTKEEINIGRMKECDIELHDSKISGLHCQLTLVGGYWHVRDMASTNGTKRNGIPLAAEETKRLDPGDVLSVGKYQFEIRYDPRKLGARY